MRFSEWLDKLNKQQARLNDLALSEVSEVISIDNHTIAITLGKKKYDAEIDGTNTGPRFLRPLYTNNKEEFDSMLESITQSTQAVVEATEVILTAVSDKAIPNAVIARMKGEQTSGEPADLVESMVEKKLTKLSEEVGEAPYGVFDNFSVDLGNIAERRLVLRADPLCIYWGRISIQRDRVQIPDAEEAMFFLANYDLIRERILRFIEQIKAIK